MAWSIDWMKCLPTLGTAKDYVVQCGWRCTATGQGQTATAYSSCSFKVPDNPGGSITPYDQLTEQQVLGWVWSSGVDKSATEASVAKQLNDLINPPIVQPPLPWAK